MNPPKPKRFRRWASRLALFTVLGFITSVAVAWAIEGLPIVGSLCELVGRDSAQQFIMYGREVHSLESDSFVGRTERRWSRINDGLSRLSGETAEKLTHGAIIVVDSSQPDGITIKDVYRPSWGLQPPRTGKVVIRESIEEASGFPSPCLWKWVDEFGKGGMIELPDPDGFQQPFPGISSRGLPYLPIPIGLTIDTIFWGGLWWLAIFGLTSFKKRRRTRKGRCASCNYDLRGINAPNCPECGTPTPSPRRGEDVTSNASDR
ncbi:MAG: hypothetical protein KDA16_08120 [Phycisphaerales bacterium]|nr:hypothetical protein [Phycisphaerales bacterium]